MNKTPTKKEPSAPKAAKAKKPAIDWEAVERDYRIGSLSIRELAEKYSATVSKAGIEKRAKKEAWTRDLTDSVRVATRAKVREQVVERVKKEAEESRTAGTEKVGHLTFKEVDLAANVNATIIFGHQKRIGRLSVLLEKMTGELEDATCDQKSLAEIAEMLREADPESAVKIRQLRGLSSRIANLKIAREISTGLIADERRAFNMDEEGAKSGVDQAILDAMVSDSGLDEDD